MAGIDEIKKIRLKKLKGIEGAGLLGYPGEVKRTHTSKESLDNFSKLSKSKEELFLVGRIMSLRQHGGLLFSNIEDGSGGIQILFKKDSLGLKGYKFFLDHFDVGDFIQVKGELFKTKRGEKSLQVNDYKMLTKSLLPLPEKWHGIKDIDDRFRKRYLDLIFNPDVKEKLILRSKIIKELGFFMQDKGFLEVETPILQPVYGGATAKPFKTRLNALDMDLYLRISPELYLKRLLVGGFEKVYEIGRCFRNEGMDRAHNPDFTMLEFYWAYADYKELMKFTEEMFGHLFKKLFGKLEIEYEGKKINFKPSWKRVEYSEIFRKHTKIKLDEINISALKKEAKKLGIKETNGGKFEVADEIFKKVIRPKIEEPTFIIHYPAEAFPLAKPLDKNSEKSASFQLIIMGMEIIKAYSELNNPLIQESRFKEQEKIFEKGFGEAQRMDKDYIEALEHGMPPAAGWGMGIERLVMLLTNSHSAREVILFPTMKSK
ncbi:lysine--tRNA ligase [Patescibacteria group bacterium]|nr:lysine--tRNA ligase [Patescibacteria group bacterium]